MAPTNHSDNEEESYDSADDLDFAPDDQPAADVSDSSDSETENASSAVVKAKSKKRKRTVAKDGEAEDLGFENSGDEGIIRKGLKRRSKRGKDMEDEEGGEGGLVKTRRMRALE